MENIVNELLDQEPLILPIRLLGVSLSNLISKDQDNPSGEQLKIDY
ncbi:hypothetical protein [Cyclobacterium qasimii]|nr:hypothetical protein [Cyclobacterium qasimii]EPR70500.1 hypothetical protein ADICYQ_0924 [Cyclobacterium qasimii M12-11B]